MINETTMRHSTRMTQTEIFRLLRQFRRLRAHHRYRAKIAKDTGDLGQMAFEQELALSWDKCVKAVDGLYKRMRPVKPGRKTKVKEPPL